MSAKLQIRRNSGCFLGKVVGERWGEMVSEREKQLLGVYPGEENGEVRCTSTAWFIRMLIEPLKIFQCDAVELK